MFDDTKFKSMSAAFNKDVDFVRFSLIFFDRQSNHNNWKVNKCIHRQVMCSI